MKADSSPAIGTGAGAVFLIGAGPGDPELMTTRGMTLLRKADVVVYDHDVDPRIVRLARSDAELIDVGSGAAKALAQEAISYLVAEKAREGRSVARLKVGDPFIFDRGGEEALFLHQNGIPLEVVPGVPLTVGVPAYAGIPITYPGGGDALVIVRGYDETGKAMPDVDWNAIGHLDATLLCYASASQVPRLLDTLLAHGTAPDTPAAIITGGTLATQETDAGTVSNLLARVKDHPLKSPALLVVGKVVAFREHLRWFDRRPLFGKRIVVTRPRDQAAELVNRLTALGADTIAAPMIRIAPPEDLTPLQQSAAQASTFDWIVFTSGNAVDAFMRAVFEGGNDVRSLHGPRLCAVGAATGEKLAAYGIKVDLVPSEFRAEAAFEAIRQAGPLKDLRVLLPRADIGREVLAEALRDAGADVTEVIAYRTMAEDAQREGDPDIYGMLLNGSIDAVTFTSASAVRNFAKVLGPEQAADLLRHTAVAAIGPVTAETAATLGIGVSIQPETYTIPALVDAIASYFAEEATKPAKT
jgi:uroporphyrinogen III methyltransferase / synthase